VFFVIITIVHKTDEYKYDTTHNYVFSHEKEFTKEEFKIHLKKAKDEVLKTNEFVKKEDFIEQMKKLFSYEEIEYVRSAYLYEYVDYHNDTEDGYPSDMAEDIDDLRDWQVK
jgi:hypothetical protein